MTIERVTLTAIRPIPDQDFARWEELVRVHYDVEDELAKRLLIEAWNRVEKHCGRLWLPAAAGADRVASVEILATAGELVSALPPFPQTPDVTLDGVDKWTAGAWVALTEIQRPDPWRFRIPDNGAFRVRSTWTAPAGDPPCNIEHAAHLVAIWTSENRGGIAAEGRAEARLGAAAIMLRSGAADVLRNDRGISV